MQIWPGHLGVPTGYLIVNEASNNVIDELSFRNEIFLDFKECFWEFLGFFALEMGRF